MRELPKCPRGCASVKIMCDGVQKSGGHARQRYRCIPPDGSYHRFVGQGQLSRTRAEGPREECERMRVPTKRRPPSPEYYANGAVEAPLEEVRRVLGSRRWTFRNAQQMNMLLELVHIRYNRTATQAQFASTLRATRAGGVRPSDSVAADARVPGKRVSTSSLRA